MDPTVLIRDDDLSKSMAAAANSRGFQIIRLLSDSGGMADVYEAFQASVRRRVAAKRLKPHLANDRDIVARFREEGAKLGQLSHPNILQVIDYHDETLTLFLEFIEGTTYDEILEREGFPTPEHAIKIVADVLDGLAYAHKRRIVHRDIKPGNIFLTTDGHVKIADFGIAKILGGEPQASDQETGGWIGSPSYISPEQIIGQHVDGRADIYSTGVMLYLLLAHRLPFAGGSPRELASRHLNDAPLPPTQFNPAISPELSAVILKALAKDPSKRFRDAAEFRDTLLAFIAPRQDIVYLEQAHAAFTRANTLGFFRRKPHLDNASKLAELALHENPDLHEAANLHHQIQAVLGLHKKQSIALALIGGGGGLALAAAATALLIQAPGTLEVVTLKPVDVIVDGARVGTAPGSFALGVGKHRLMYAIPGVIEFPTGGKEIIIQENKTLEETPVVPSLAEVLVVSVQHAGASIVVDGVVQSAHVPAKLSLLYGEHAIEVANIKRTVMVDRDSVKVEF